MQFLAMFGGPGSGRRKGSGKGWRRSANANFQKTVKKAVGMKSSKPVSSGEKTRAQRSAYGLRTYNAKKAFKTDDLGKGWTGKNSEYGRMLKEHDKAVAARKRRVA